MFRRCVFNPEGFAGKYGSTIAERRSSRFDFVNPDKCKVERSIVAICHNENPDRHD